VTAIADMTIDPVAQSASRRPQRPSLRFTKKLSETSTVVGTPRADAGQHRRGESRPEGLKRRGSIFLMSRPGPSLDDANKSKRRSHGVSQCFSKSLQQQLWPRDGQCKRSNFFQSVDALVSASYVRCHPKNAILSDSLEAKCQLSALTRESYGGHFGAYGTIRDYSNHKQRN
jgi:hypothetical protein